MSILLGLAATNTGNNLIYLIDAALLGFMGISGYFGRKNLMYLDLELEFPTELYCAKPFPVRIKIKNQKKYIPVFLLNVIVGESRVLFPFIDSLSEAEAFMTLTFSKRGAYTVDDIYVCSVFPFNFFVRCRKIKKTFDVIVFPAPRRCEFAWYFERGYGTVGEVFASKMGSGAEMLSVRSYIKGDPLKYISWKATAKTGSLKTKEFAFEANRPIVIEYDKISFNSVEEKVSCIAYYILHLFKNNVPVGLKIGDRLYKPNLG
ncbi:MAG: DUF58 domain-containing protein, partial [Candidatus Magnetoovum sp. WYHC-5]|nr:DUF58 domain-containing protein [Candidatus Magnetoovum sp. WYHC-5]